MIAARLGIGCSAALAAPLLAQDLLWQRPIPPSTTEYEHLMPFADYDRDGCRDFLQVVTLLSNTANQQFTLQICSGRDSAVLWQTPNLGFWGQRFACHAGDLDLDGWPDLFFARNLQNGSTDVVAYSPRTSQALWQVSGPTSGQYGYALLGDLDVDGDGRPDLVTITSHISHSQAYVYDHQGALLYTVPCLSLGRIAISLADLGDLDGDGGDDFVIGCNDSTTQGALVVVSGRTGTILRVSHGLLPGDKLADHASNFGDLDGDGVDDYAGFPWITAQRAIAVVFSGATGQVLRTWPEFGNSVVCGEDCDQDGVPDLVVGADWLVAPNTYGSTRCYSGRDGTELWRVEHVPAVPGSGYGSSGGGWMEYSASLGVQPGNPYPVVAWLDFNYAAPGTFYERVRAYRTSCQGQGVVTGSPCTSSGTEPRIGARRTTTGCRITVARSHAGALGALLFALDRAAPWPAHAALPLDLAPLGMPGCDLHLVPDTLTLRLLGTTGIDRGYAQVDLPHQLTTIAGSLGATAQWLVFDPATLAYAATAAHSLQGL